MSIKKNNITGVFLALLGLLMAVDIVGCSKRNAARKIRHVVLISIDTCRADHLSCYGFNRLTTPQIDEIAAEGILFSRTQAPAPLTLPAHCSLLTGTYPPYHQVHDNLRYRLLDSHETLAEILQSQGWTTGAVTGSFVLDKQFGLNQGFASYQDEFEQPIGEKKSPERRGEEVSRFAGEFLTKNQSKPFFLFLHYFDPHTDYEPPAPFASEYADDLYAGEIAYTDQCIRQVIDQLKSLGLYDSTLLVVVGDHGESLGEHGESEHGYFIYQSNIHVPFIIREPGGIPPKKVDQTVSLVDVTPTILGYLDIPVPVHMQGNDLSDISTAEIPMASPRQVYTESLTATKLGCNPLLGLVEDQWSFIHSNQPELYDLQQDPDQLRNLAEQEEQRVRLMRSQLQEMVLELIGAESGDSTIDLDEETRKRLESLGYVGSGEVDEELALDPTKKDAKEMIECYEGQREASNYISQEQYKEANKILDQIISRWPDVDSTYFLKTEAAYESHNHADTIKYGIMYLRMNSDDIQVDGNRTNRLVSMAFDMVAYAGIQVGEYEMVVNICQQQLTIDPKTVSALNNMALVYSRTGRQKTAIRLWEKVLQLDPKLVSINSNLGMAYFELNEHQKAVQHWLKALPYYSNSPQLLANIGMSYYKLKQFEPAIKFTRQALKHNPNLSKAVYNLARFMLESNDEKLCDLQEAFALAQKACEMTEFRDAYALDTLSTAYERLGKIDEALEYAQKALQIAESLKVETLTKQLEEHIKQLKLKKGDRR